MAVAEYMERCNGHYYSTRDPLGVAGDFTTAPEISQLFGELIGAWCADMWLRAGSPAPLQLAELGPGRGTLMSDLRRAASSVPGFADAARLSFVETSPILAVAAAERHGDARIVDDIGEIDPAGPLLLIANEFFDALPVRQTVAGSERQVVERGGSLALDPAEGDIIETSPAAAEIVRQVAARLERAGGAALIVDYGYAGGESGDSLQAVSRHRSVSPLSAPGDVDLTCHVDFAALAAAAKTAGMRVHGPVTQGAFLSHLGIGMRAETLMKRAGTEVRGEVARAVHRLTAPQEMGGLFKAMAIVAPGWPTPAGFPA